MACLLDCRLAVENWFTPPLSFLIPCPSPWGGGSLGQPKIFCCSSLCCCVGDCVVGHCHLYPLYSWQDILLLYAEMELEMEVLGTSGILQGTFPKGNGFPKICLRLPSLLLRRQNHHPRVLPKVFQWKVESMYRSSR